MSQCCSVDLSVRENRSIDLDVLGESYLVDVPTMSTSVKGGAKVGSGLEVTDATLYVKTGNWLDIGVDNSLNVVPETMTANTAGVAKLGSGLNVDGNKILSIADSGVTTDKLADGAVTTAKIADGSITYGKLDASAVYELPTMTTSVKGGAKLGSGLNVDSDGALNAGKINESADITGSNQSIFINNDALTTAEVTGTNAKVARVTETGMESFVTNAIFGSTNVNGERDCCAAVTLANSYLRFADQFVYANAYTATTYEGTYSTPTASNPYDHKVDNKLPIDCATLTTLIGNGCLEENSRYSSNGHANYFFHAMYPETSESIKPYWLYNPRKETLSSVGYGRLLSDAQAKMFYDAGKLQLNTQTEGLQIGDIVYSGNSNNRFLGITHCSLVAGMIDATSAGMIIVEATTGTANAIISRTIADSGITGNLRAIVSPNYTCGIRLNATYGNYLIIDNAKNLNTSALNVTAPGNSAGGNPASVIAITPNTSSNYNLTISLANGISTISKSLTCNGVKLFILPRGWSGTISSTSTGYTWNIATQRCCTDKMIYIAPRT